MIVVMDYNLLATSDQLSVSQACSELWMGLRAAGDPEPRVNRSRVKGLVVARTSMDPVEAVHGLRAHLASDPGRLGSVYRVMPVQAWAETSVDRVVDAVRALAVVMGPGDSFRVTLEKRRTQLRSLEIIDAVASAIEMRVDLENPDWVVLVEVVGNETGVSVVRPSDILNVQKERAALSSE
jgi:tRNA acetyltransferase TAN1